MEAYFTATLQHLTQLGTLNATFTGAEHAEVPALYFLAKLKALRAVPDSDLCEIHKAKVTHGDVRLLQDAQ